MWFDQIHLKQNIEETRKIMIYLKKINEKKFKHIKTLSKTKIFTLLIIRVEVQYNLHSI